MRNVFVLNRMSRTAMHAWQIWPEILAPFWAVFPCGWDGGSYLIWGDRPDAELRLTVWHTGAMRTLMRLTSSLKHQREAKLAENPCHLSSSCSDPIHFTSRVTIAYYKMLIAANVHLIMRPRFHCLLLAPGVARESGSVYLFHPDAFGASCDVGQGSTKSKRSHLKWYIHSTILIV